MRFSSTLTALSLALAGAACAAEPVAAPDQVETPAAELTATPSPAPPEVTTTPTPDPTPELVGGPWRLVADELATEPTELAGQVTAAERALRDAATPEGEFERAAQLQQVAYRRLADDDVLWRQVRPLLDPDHVTDTDLHVDARRQFSGMHARYRDTLPAWSIEDPEPASELVRHYKDSAEAAGIEWEYLAAVNLVETGMGRIVGLSTAGAQGPMQFLPSTWVEVAEGGDINDPRDAIFGAGRYLRRNGMADGRIDDALFRYNNSRRYVEGVKAYAELIRSHPRAYEALHAWQIVYRTASHGDLVLPVGYLEPEAIDAADWLAKQD